MRSGYCLYMDTHYIGRIITAIGLAATLVTSPAYAQQGLEQRLRITHQEATEQKDYEFIRFRENVRNLEHNTPKNGFWKSKQIGELIHKEAERMVKRFGIDADLSNLSIFSLDDKVVLGYGGGSQYIVFEEAWAIQHSEDQINPSYTAYQLISKNGKFAAASPVQKLWRPHLIPYDIDKSRTSSEQLDFSKLYDTINEFSRYLSTMDLNDTPVLMFLSDEFHITERFLGLIYGLEISHDYSRTKLQPYFDTKNNMIRTAWTDKAGIENVLVIRPGFKAEHSWLPVWNDWKFDPLEPVFGSISKPK